MSGIVASLQHLRDKNSGVGTNSQAIKFLNQDYEALRQRCLEGCELFTDDTFPALPSSLGFKELGRGSPKIRGVEWIRPTVSPPCASEPAWIESPDTNRDLGAVCLRGCITACVFVCM